MTLFHLFLGAVLCGYLAPRLLIPLRHRKAAAAALGLLIAFGSFKFAIVRTLGGPRFFAPDLPGWALHLCAWGFGWVYFLTLLMLLAEPVRGAWALFRRMKRRPGLSRKQVNILHASFCAAAAILASLALYGGMRAPEVHEIELAFPDLPPAADGLRIAVLSDVHAGATVPASRVREMVRRTVAAAPDLILLAGDYFDGSVAEVGKDVAPLGELRAPLGVYAVTGNHEYYCDYPAWRTFLAGLGPVMLENEAVDLPGRGVRIAGIPDRAGESAGRGPDPARALAGADRRFTILLAHRPDHAPEAAALGARLQISGHTHGGSVYGLDRLVAKFNAGYVSGLYRVGDMTLAVCNGTGIWNGMPLRLGAPSEILLITLKRRP